MPTLKENIENREEEIDKVSRSLILDFGEFLKWDFVAWIDVP